MRIILFAALMLHTSLLVAEGQAEKRVNISLGSKHTHTDSETNYQEVNIGAAVETPINQRWYFIAGAFQNSFNNLSAYAGAGWDIYTTHRTAIFIETLAIAGYEQTFIGITPGFRFKLLGSGVKINYAPIKSLGIGESDVWTFQYQLSF